MTPEIIFADKDLVVINKPHGIPVHGGNTISGATLVDFILEKYPEIKTVGEDPVRPGIVHRLDKNTSGVMIVARNQKTFEFLKDLFKNRRIEKKYHAILCKTPKNKEGTITMPIGRLVKNPTKRGVEQGKIKIRGARDAMTKYRVLKEGIDYALVELTPKTGRMHQLRVHMKTLGHPIACDQAYGGKKVCCPAGCARQLLHAQSIAFSFPEGRRLFFEADYPEDFALAVKKVL